MLEPFEAYLEAAWATLRLADLVDIAVVSVFVYGVIRWFRSARSRLVVNGFLTLVGLYLAARLLEMHLTLALFQAGITVVVVALVVIFQNEIRRVVERVALASRFGSARATAAADGDVDTIIETVATMAHHKTGALVVLRGREPLERHLTGGVVLNGKLSEPLLYSIFDASSPGHDGAMIYEDGLVTRFAAHLPLSVEIQGDEHFGTRHTAALGLSERCDALVIVVSEERGTISVAQDGRLVELAAVAELKRRINDFMIRISPERRVGHLKRVLTSGLGLKALSVVIAAVAWGIALGYRSETAVRTLSVPIVLENVPAGWSVDNPSPFEVRVALSGPKRDVERVTEGDVTISLDASRVKQGLQQTAISSSEVDAPSGLVVQHIEPSTVRFRAERTVTRRVRVHSSMVGSLPAGRTLQSISVEPDHVEVVVPRSKSGSIHSIPTEPVVLDELRQSTKIERILLPPEGTTLAPGEPRTAAVRIDIGVGQ
jgi:diadenylate cyclase